MSLHRQWPIDLGIAHATGVLGGATNTNPEGDYREHPPTQSSPTSIREGECRSLQMRDTQCRIRVQEQHTMSPIL